ncbi:hypothetical protein GCM10028799_59760 [Kribbella italica]
MRSHGPCTLPDELLLRARTLVTVSQTGENANLMRLTSSALSLMLITSTTLVTVRRERED